MRLIPGSRRGRVVVGLAVLALVGAGGLVLWLRPSRITLENGALIHVGMTSDEVHANLLWRAKRQWRRWFPE
jgi:hypothetical protein